MGLENFNPHDKMSEVSEYKNFNLLFNKFPQFIYNSQNPKDSGFEFYKQGEKKRDSSKREFFLGKVLRKGKCDTFFDYENFVKPIQQNYYNQIEKTGYITNLNDKKIDFKPEWRMNIGLGGESVYETGITLHHIYGFPYIPATAIKGITHHYANEEKIDEKLILEIFGSEDSDNSQKGKVIFFDAFPIDKIVLSPDIMNNHYPDYYGGGENIKPPADWQSPRPILFLTVKDTSFKFVVGMKPKDYNKDLFEKAIDLLKNALQEKGIGAKTAIGYGYMSEKI